MPRAVSLTLAQAENLAAEQVGPAEDNYSTSGAAAAGQFQAEEQVDQEVEPGQSSESVTSVVKAAACHILMV